jgi:hypothetical protein
MRNVWFVFLAPALLEAQITSGALSGKVLSTILPRRMVLCNSRTEEDYLEAGLSHGQPGAECGARNPRAGRRADPHVPA